MKDLGGLISLVIVCEHAHSSVRLGLVLATSCVVLAFRRRCEFCLKMACNRKLNYFDVSEAKESSSAVVDGMVTERRLSEVF